MSAWKIAIRRLHALGGVATTMQITEDIEATGGYAPAASSDGSPKPLYRKGRTA